MRRWLNWDACARSIRAVFWALTVLMPVGCSTQGTLEDEHALVLAQATEEPLRVVDYYPALEVPGVPMNIQPYLFFNRAVEDMDALSLSMEGLLLGNVLFSGVPDFDRAGLAFVPQGSVTPAETADRLCFSVQQDSMPLIGCSTFSTTFPSGPLFNMTIGLTVEAFGGSIAQAVLLQSFFTPGVYPLWVMVPEGLDSKTALPASISLYMGPGYIRSGGTYRMYRHVGFSTVFPDVYIQSDGTFEATSDGDFVPLDTPEAVVPTWMASIHISGRFRLDQTPLKIESLVLESIIPTRSLLLLADTSESYASAVNSLSLDVDLNGNGVKDSATFRVRSSPEEIPATLWDP